jgi:hypothetical protein
LSVDKSSQAKLDLLKQIHDMLKGHDVEFASSVAMSILLNSLVAAVPDRDQAKIDALADNLADQLKTASRNALKMTTRAKVH